MYNFLVAQIFGVLGIIFSVLSMQMKAKKNIMIMLLFLNLSSALNFLYILFFIYISVQKISPEATIPVFTLYFWEQKLIKCRIKKKLI